jgi:hypothetical protein
MQIDIDKLSEAELIELNHRMVEPAVLSQMRAHSQMLDFKIGERGGFSASRPSARVRHWTRCNRKTVRVITESGQHWNVAPGLLRRADQRDRNEDNAKVIRLRRD